MTAPESNEPLETFMIEDLETLRALSDPLRMQIYEILVAEPASVRQIADRLGMGASRLYYHINSMEKLGLLRVVETRMVSNMVEKLYRAVAYRLDVAPNLLHFGSDEGTSTVLDMLATHLDATREDLVRSLHVRQQDLAQGAAPRQRNVLVNRTIARIPDARAEEFSSRLVALIEEFTASDTPAAKTPPGEGETYQNYALTVAFYPSFYFGAAAESQ